METLRWLKDAFTQPLPAELAALPQPQARAERAALLSLAVMNVVVLLLCLALFVSGKES